MKIVQSWRKHENWHIDAFRNGEVKLIRSLAKIYVETISWGAFCFRPV